MKNKLSLSRICLVVALAMIMSAALMGCGGNKANEGSQPSPSSEANPTAAASPQPTDAKAEDQTPKELTEITVSTVGNTAMYGPIYYAQDKNLWEKYGLKVNLVGFDAAAATAALISGSVQIIYDGPAVVEAAVKTDRVKVVGTGGKVAMSLYAKSISTLEELKGKTIGVTAAGGSIDTAARTTVQGLGFEPDKDVKFLYTGSNAATLAALKEGKLDAGVFSPPTTIQAEEMGLKKIASLDKTKGTLGLYGYFGVYQPFAEKNPEAVQSFFDAYAEAVKLAKDDKAFTSESIGSHTKVTDAKAKEVSFDEYKDLWLTDLHIPENEVQVMLDKSKDEKAKTLKVSDVLDHQYADLVK